MLKYPVYTSFLFWDLKKTLIYLKVRNRNYFLYRDEKELFHIVAILFKRYLERKKLTSLTENIISWLVASYYIELLQQ